MPFFLIPFAVGVYMYFENKRKEAEAGGEGVQDQHDVDEPSGNVKTGDATTTTVIHTNGTQGACDIADPAYCDQVIIEAQLSSQPQGQSSPPNGDNGECPHIKVTFESRGVPERQESEVSIISHGNDSDSNQETPPSMSRDSSREQGQHVPSDKVYLSRSQRLARTTKELSKFLGDPSFALCGSPPCEEY